MRRAQLLPLLLIAGCHATIPLAPRTTLVEELGAPAVRSEIERTLEAHSSVVRGFVDADGVGWEVVQHSAGGRTVVEKQPFVSLSSMALRKVASGEVYLWFYQGDRLINGVGVIGETAARRLADLIGSAQASRDQFRTEPSVALAPPTPAPAPTSPPPPTQDGRYHALVIGNDDYAQLPDLQTAVRDASDVATLLREAYRFEVHTIHNGSRRDIVSALSGLRRTLQPEDSLLIYYAGHGYLDRGSGEGYWLPVEADPEDVVDWVSNATITTALKALPARHVLVVADSCYSGSLTRGVDVVIRPRDEFATIRQRRARVVLTSGGLEPVADAGGEGNSVFAKHLLRALRENQGTLDAATLFSQIRRPVMVNSDQTPEYGDIRKCGHDGGDFLFVRPPQ